MSNRTTKAQRHNARLDKIWDEYVASRKRELSEISEPLTPQDEQTCDSDKLGRVTVPESERTQQQPSLAWAPYMETARLLVMDAHLSGDVGVIARLLQERNTSQALLRRFYEQTYGKTDLLSPLDFEQAREAIAQAGRAK